MDEIETALSMALDQTGFPFEHFAFQAAQADGWTTRSNRLYVDAEEDKTREMDLLCYRYGKRQEVGVYTALLISCKARTAKPWVLLTRPWPSRTSSWYPYPPVPVWTNSHALRHEVEKPAWGLNYFNLAEASGLKSWSSDSPREVFALHEFEVVAPHHGKMDRKNRPPAPIRCNSKGDSSLYEGTMSLLKALAYETAAVEERKGTNKEPMLYQFNLIQLLDGDLYEAEFSNSAPAVRRVDRYRYFARTMLGGKDFSARIEFCTKPAFEQLLGELTRVHDFNCLHFNARVEHFYDTVLIDVGRRDSLLPRFAGRLATAVGLYGGIQPPSGPGWLRIEFKDEVLKVFAWIGDDAINRLQVSQAFNVLLKRIVADVYRYTGQVELVEDDEIPF